MATPKLKDNPEVIALVEAAVTKSRKAVIRAAIKAVKEVAAGFVADAKAAGNRAGVDLTKRLGADAATAVANIGADAEAA